MVRPIVCALSLLASTALASDLPSSKDSTSSTHLLPRGFGIPKASGGDAEGATGGENAVGEGTSSPTAGGGTSGATSGDGTVGVTPGEDAHPWASGDSDGSTSGEGTSGEGTSWEGTFGSDGESSTGEPAGESIEFANQAMDAVNKYLDTLSSQSGSSLAYTPTASIGVLLAASTIPALSSVPYPTPMGSVGPQAAAYYTRVWHGEISAAQGAVIAAQTPTPTPSYSSVVPPSTGGAGTIRSNSKYLLGLFSGVIMSLMIV